MNGQDLVETLKAGLKRKRITYAQAAKELGMSEANVKRMMSLRRMSLQQLDAFCGLLGIDVARLAAMTEERLSPNCLPDEIEALLVADKRLLLVFFVIHQNWTDAAILANFYISEVELKQYKRQLMDLKLIELAGHRWRSRLPARWTWPPGGRVAKWLRRQLDRHHILGGAQPDNSLSPMLLTLSPGAAGKARQLCTEWEEQLTQIAADDLAPDGVTKQAFLVVSGIRQWNWSPFDDLLRQRSERVDQG